MLLLLLAPSAVLTGRAVLSGLPDFSVDADMAVTELYTWRAAHAEQWLGPYSRFGFHHPGPLMFYALAPVYAATGERFGGLLLAGGLLNALTLAAAVAVAWWSAGRWAAVWTAVALALYVLFLGPNLLRSVWNPNLSLLPFALAVLAFAGALAGRPWLLVVAAVAASFALQSHLAYLLPLVTLATLAAGVAFLRRRRARAARSPAGRSRLLAAGAVAVGTALLLWLPSLVEAFGEGANLTRVARFVRVNGPGHSPIEGAAILMRTMGAFLLAPAGARAQAPPPEELTIVATTALVLACAAALWRATRHGNLFVTALSGLTLAAACAAVPAVAGIVGKVEPHLVRWMTALGPLAAIAALLAFAAPARGGPRRTAALLASLLAGGGLAAANVAAAFNVTGLAAGAREPRFTRVARLATATAAGLRRAGVAAPRLGVFSTGSWGEAAGVALQLVKNGFEVGADPAWEHVLGKGGPAAAADAALVFASASDAAAIEAHSEATIIAREGDVAALLAVPHGNEVVSFSFAAPLSVLYCAAGFYGPEGGVDGFRWSEGRTSQVVLPTRAGRRYRLTVRAAGAVDGRGVQTVTLTADGKGLGLRTLDNAPSDVAWEIPPGAARSVVLTFSFGHTVVPHQVSDSTDTRELAVRFYRLSAEPSDGAPTFTLSGRANA